MKAHFLRAGLAFLLAGGLSACDPAPIGAGNGSVTEKDGLALYQTQCAVCHGPQGQGMPGLHPPLVASEWTTGAPDRLIALTLDGLIGEMKVQGATYRGVMPAWKAVLSDAQIAAVLTTVRQSWGNQASPIEAVDVSRVRRQSASRNAFWSPGELEHYPGP